jgi:hypothetical protein
VLCYGREVPCIPAYILLSFSLSFHETVGEGWVRGITAIEFSRRRRKKKRTKIVTTVASYVRFEMRDEG